MLRALVGKEWRQLRLVRWGGILLGAVLPIALVAGAELSARGLLPTGRTSGVRPRDIMYEILPAALALALWPLIALMAAAQAFGGDRAARTESFLLERPVPRTRVWGARVAASGATLVTVVLATAALGAGLALVSGPPPAIGWSRWGILSAVGLGAAALAWIGGTFTASLLASPLAAVLLGAIAGAVPVVLGAESMSVFPFARFGAIPIGTALCVLLLPALVVAAWSASSRGEPAGRGRVKRGLAISGASLAAVPLVFAAITPVALRIDAGRGLHAVDPSPAGNAAIVATSDEFRAASWLVRVPDGTTLRFLSPPMESVAWSRDGALVGVLTWAGPLGSQRSSQRIDLVDSRTGSVVRSLAIPEREICTTFVLAGEAIAAVFFRNDDDSQTAEVYIARPRAATWTATGFRHSRAYIRLVGPLDDGRLFAQLIEWAKRSDRATHGRVYRLYPVDLDTASVGGEIGSGAASDAVWRDRRYGGMSPSGRYEIIAAPEEIGGYAILDLRKDAMVPAFWTKKRPCWLEGDRLAWIESETSENTLFVAAIGGATKPIRSWGDANVGLSPSPDGKALFVSVVPTDAKRPARPDVLWSPPGGSGPLGKVPEEIVYLPVPDRTVDLAPPFSAGPHDLRYSQWAGPKTLARIGKGVVYFEDIDRPGERRFVIGGPGDLR